MSASRPAAVTPPDFTTLTVTLENAVARVTLNRPDKANAMNAPMWVELKAAMEWLDETPQARVGIITGAGRFFTAGIDLAMLGAMKDEVADGCAAFDEDAARRPREAKVSDLQLMIDADKEIVRFHVPVQDPVFVAVREALQHHLCEALHVGGGDHDLLVLDHSLQVGHAQLEDLESRRGR